MRRAFRLLSKADLRLRGRDAVGTAPNYLLSNNMAGVSAATVSGLAKLFPGGIPAPE
jgi:hypothetical protein